MNVRHLLIIGVVGGGGLLVAFGLARLWLSEWRLTGAATSSGEPARSPVRRWHVAVLAIILCGATILRLQGVEQRGMTHVEVYVPGIDLPPDISEPAPRTTLRDVVLWHWQNELHPPGYYVFMFGWTRAFGTGLFSIRLPSVLLGVASVALLFALGARLFNPLTGLAAATLLAINGHQIYWSQHARMYIVASALGLLSTLLLFDLLRKPERAPLREAAYIVVTWLALFTQLLPWALLAAQILAVALFARAPSGSYPRLIRSQALIVILGTPFFAHALLHSRESYLERPGAGFLRNYLAFGFLFEPEDFSRPVRTEPALAAGLAAIAAVVCLWFALRRYRERLITAGNIPASQSGVGPVAFGSALLTVGLAMLSWNKQGLVAAAAILPMVTWILMAAMPRLWPRLQRLQERLPRTGLGDGPAFAMLMTLVPMFAVFVVSLKNPIMSSRAVVLFVPMLVLLLAAGLVAMSRHRIGVAAMAAVILAVHVVSIRYYRVIPTPVDYRGLAAHLTSDIQSGDMIFVPAQRFGVTPLFYHLDRTITDRLVAGSFGDRVRQKPNARIWVPLFGEQEPIDSIAEALRGYKLETTLLAHRAQARLYVPVSR